jgi:hypothetical protein
MIYKLALTTVPIVAIEPTADGEIITFEIGPPHAPIHGHSRLPFRSGLKVGDKLQLYTEITLNQQVN